MLSVLNKLVLKSKNNFKNTIYTLKYTLCRDQWHIQGG